MFCDLPVICSVSGFKARPPQPLVLRMTPGVWLVSQHRQSRVTDALVDDERQLECSLVYQTQEKESRPMDFYPVGFKEQISKEEANHRLV